MKKPGDKVDRYIIEAPLGRGGMGEVYEATDTRLGRRVALKLIPPGADADANQRMVREARAAASFEHPNAVVVFDVGESEGATYLAMELVRGTLLRARVGDADVPVGRRLRWLVDVARALGAAHAHGIVHRDIKPDNVMIRDDGVAKVLDFGIARRQAKAIDPSAPTEAGAAPIATITAAGVIVGTPQYAAPEQLRGEALDGRADQFSWAVMAYELLAGSAPWRATDSVALLSQILSADPPPLAERAPDLPEPVALAVTRALHKRADDRFDSIDEIADVIEPFADAVATSTGKREAATPIVGSGKRPTTIGRVARGTGRVIVWIFAVIGGVIVIGLGSLIALGISRGTLEYNGKRLSTRAPDAGAPVIAAVGCADAKVEGEGATAEIADAIGRAACARFATELGVDWGGDDKTSLLTVTASLGAGEARVTLAIADRRAEGKGATPIDAIAAASSSLAKQLSPPALREEDIRAWGAPDAAGARHIERVWRELLLNITPNEDVAVKALVASVPRSAWSHAIFALASPRGTDESKAAVRRGLELVDALPPARAHALRGTLMIIDGPDPDTVKEAMRLLRLAYTEAPDDGDVAALYAAVAIAAGAEGEGFGVLDRLLARFPAKSLLAMHNAIGRGVDRDLDRDGRYVARMRAILPESFAWEESVQHLGEAGRVADARAALAFARRLGFTGKSAGTNPLELGEAWLELVALEPRAAREVSGRVRGDPRVSVSTMGAVLGAASHFMEGRVLDGESALRNEIDRQRAVGTRRTAAWLGYHVARSRRWLGRPPPEAELIAPIEQLAAEIKSADWSVTRLIAEAALARAAASPRDGKRILDAALADIEARADKEREAHGREAARLSALPLVRVARGDAAAVKLWIESERAPFNGRRSVAFDAALALEAAGKRAEAEGAYRLALDARDIQGHALSAMMARVRLAPLLRASGKADEAAALDAAVQRVWQRADAGLVEAVKKMR